MPSSRLRASGLVLLLVCSSYTVAQEALVTPVKLNIAAQPLGKALNAWASQTGYQVVIPERAAQGRTAPGVSGRYTPEGALKVLLASSDLHYQFVGSRIVTIRETQSEVDAKSLAAEPKRKSQTEEGQRPLALAQSRPREMEVAASQVAPNTSSQGQNGRRDGVQEVIVTATKRAERLVDVPQSMTVLSADDLYKGGAVQFRDFADSVPGLSFQSAGAGYTQISLRGVTVGQDSGPTVGIYVDEVPYGSSTTFGQGSRFSLDVGLFDLDRIEVLRGPQGTLYGASTMGGLIKYVSKAPDGERFAGTVRTGISETEYGGVGFNASAAVNTPLVADKLALRASGFELRDGGYIDNAALGKKNVNRSDVYGGRLDLLYVPIEALRIRVTGFLQNISKDGFPLADFSLSGVPVDDDLTQRRRWEEPLDQHFRLVSATASYDMGPATLSSISSYQTVGTLYFVDFNPVFLPTLQALKLPFSSVAIRDDTSTDKFTQEIRLSSDGKRTIEWLLGWFYTHEVSSRTSEFVLRDLSDQPAANTLLKTIYPSTYDEHAAFGDLTWHLTEKFDVTGGVRYGRNHQAFEQIGSGLFGRTAPTAYSTEGVFTYLANARYHFNERATGYIRYATGYRPGGPNFVFNDPLTGLPIGSRTFAADRLKSYEAGFKIDDVDRRVGLDLSAYHVDWTNIQILVSRNGFSAFDNAPGGATVDGAELTLTARPVRAFTISSSFAYQDAKLSEANAALGAVKGERLPNVPHLTAALSGDSGLPIGTLEPSVGATVRYVGSRPTSFDRNTSFPQYQLPSYTTVDLRASVKFNSVDVQLYVHNALDERGELAPRLASSPLKGPIQLSILQPRTVGLMASMSF